MEITRCSAGFLVIGSGVAGLSAAIEASRYEEVLLITKKNLKDSATQHAQGGIAVPLGKRDSSDLHFQDTIKAGAGLCNPAAVRTLVKDGPQEIFRLIEWGAQFDKKGSSYDLGREAAHSRSRVIHASGDATGQEVERTLLEKLSTIKNCQVQENIFLLDFIVSDGKCSHVLAYDEKAKNILVIEAKAVLLASGGMGQIYGITTNPEISTGDGIASAYRCGAELTDLEFVQFHPTALYLENQQIGKPLFLISEALRGEGAILRNSSGYAFMADYDKRKELAPRDVVTRAIFREMEKTGCSFVYLDISPIENFAGRFPNIRERCKKSGIKLSKKMIPVELAAHYMMGGVKTDLWGHTSIPGLFAAGEVACTGVQGANRLASNSLLEGLVFGTRMAQAAKKYIKNSGKPKSKIKVSYAVQNPEQLKKLDKKLMEIRASLQSVMWSRVGIIRSEASLTEALEDIRTLKGALEKIVEVPVIYTPYLELRNMIEVSELIAGAALQRTESRGSHFRSDFPKENDNVWKRHILISK